MGIYMGIYLNSSTAYTLYGNEAAKPYFVDKTRMLEELFPQIGEGNNYICITRPRRFGKTVMANMIASFFSKACDSSKIFNHIAYCRTEAYQQHLNKHNVIHISFNELPKRCKTYEQYIERIERILINDLKIDFPDVAINEDEAVWDILMRIYMADNTIRFIFVLDEWDYIFHRKFVTDDDRKPIWSF